MPSLLLSKAMGLEENVVATPLVSLRSGCPSVDSLRRTRNRAVSWELQIPTV